MAGASPYGVLDMAGNVRQWCLDWYEGNYYQHSPPRNPTGPATGSTRVLRGGAWDDHEAKYLNATYRKWFDPSFGNFFSGFRCLCTQPGP